jgi:hypothetical protein
MVLLGDGQNSFRPVPAGESGLAVPLDVKKMALLPSGETQFILFGINDGPLQFWKLNK